ncbi:MAG: cytochrome P450 [Actinobacteria bacterium]|nr:MAG: cytochrome P450 [Actinomycetota bacterium]
MDVAPPRPQSHRVVRRGVTALRQPGAGAQPHLIPAYANVAVAYAAANRDPEVFADPDAFLLDRPAGRHVAFGLGAHFCVGAWLARAEARLCFEALFDRFSTLERGEGSVVMQHHSRVVRGPAVLPLAFA